MPMPLTAALQNSHRNGGRVFLIFVANPRTMRSCSSAARAGGTSQHANYDARDDQFIAVTCGDVRTVLAPGALSNGVGRQREDNRTGDRLRAYRFGCAPWVRHRSDDEDD